MHYNSKSKRVLHNIKVRYAASKNVGKRATEDSHSLKVITTVKWVHTRALLHSQSVCFFGTLAFALVRFFASAWHWRDRQRAVRGGVACIGCKLEASVQCIPSLSCSQALPSVDSQAMLLLSTVTFKTHYRVYSTFAELLFPASRNVPSIHNVHLFVLYVPYVYVRSARPCRP